MRLTIRLRSALLLVAAIAVVLAVGVNKHQRHCARLAKLQAMGAELVYSWQRPMVKEKVIRSTIHPPLTVRGLEWINDMAILPRLRVGLVGFSQLYIFRILTSHHLHSHEVTACSSHGRKSVENRCLNS